MANIKVSELTEATEFNSNDYTMIVQANQSKKIKKENMFDKDIYSTSETKTNKVWIDGKPIYRKVISATSPSSVNIWVGVGSISNLSVLISISGTLAGTSDGRILPINYPEPSYEIVTTVIRGSVQMRTSTSVFTSKPCHIILEYTKTTD